MASDLIKLDVRSRRQWRAWLQKHHASSPGVWLVYYKAPTGLKAVSYEDSVREALCFGWIDSLIKSFDQDRYLRKFTPRKSTSAWSDSNRKRYKELKAAGELAAAGKAAPPTIKRHAPPPKIPLRLPAYIQNALRKNPSAWSSFQQLPERHRREYILWIHSAKRLETRQKRIAESLRMLDAGQKLGLK